MVFIEYLFVFIFIFFWVVTIESNIVFKMNFGGLYFLTKSAGL
jgi:hypothetical protein